MPRADLLPSAYRQGGAALFVVTVLLLLCGLAAFGAVRVSLLGESLVGNAADSARAFAAAEDLMRDAQTDVLGTLPDGAACRSGAGFTGCRSDAGGVFFPSEPGDMDRLSDAVAASPDLPCVHGICVPAGIEQLADIDKILDGITDAKRTPPAYATYGEFTGAADAPAGGAQRNPYLTADTTRYWVEVFDYPVATGIAAGGSRYQPDPSRPFIFRITAVVLGRKPGTRAVLRQIFVPSPLSANP